MPTVFGRKILFQVGADSTSARSTEELQVDFNVEHARAGTPSKAVINVWNLSEATLGLLDEEGATVRVLASLLPTVPMQIFQGQVVDVHTDRTGAERVTKIEAEDGGQALRESRVTINVATAVTAQRVLDLALEQMGIPKGTVRTDLTTEFSDGFTFQGPARDLLRVLADSTASDWMVVDGALVFLERGGATSTTAPVFSATTGNLIGAPIRKKGGAVEARALLSPQLRPGGRFVVESQRVNGTFIADRVQFVGGNYSDPFYVIATGRPA